jgi:short-subunit dehydrogenase
MQIAQAFAPTLKAHGGGAIVNILSVLSFFNLPGAGTYSASKSAAWNITNALRAELRAQNTQVLAAHMGFMDTDMTKGIDAPKANPADTARTIVAALQAGQEEVLTDDTSRQLKAGLTAERPAYLG